MAARIHAVTTQVYRAPLAVPVVTSFGTMTDRPMLLVRIEDSDGAVGWGEAWCNFPSVGAEHRARLVESVLGPLLAGADVADPAEAFATLTARTAVLAIQSGEMGPLAQAIAGVDIALWDLHARRLSQPLWRLLGGAAGPWPAYASGINPEGAVALALARQADGYGAFKLKLGFGRARDIGNLQALRAALGPGAVLAADVNQGWSVAEALAMLPELAPFDLAWLEEPVRADTPWADWQHLAAAAPMPLAAGENLAGHAAFQAAIDSGAIRVLQPDLAKWGGFSGALPVARHALAAGLRFCPHYLGGGIGLRASAHLLAAAGGDGLLEVDANDNPLRQDLCGVAGKIREGAIRLGEEAGLGPVDVAPVARHALQFPHGRA